MINTTIVKGPKGLGFTLIGNDDSSNGDEFIQVNRNFENQIKGDFNIENFHGEEKSSSTFVFEKLVLRKEFLANTHYPDQTTNYFCPNIGNIFSNILLIYFT